MADFELLFNLFLMFVSSLTNFFGSIGTLSCKQSYSSAILSETRDHTHEQHTYAKSCHTYIGTGYVHWIVFHIFQAWEFGCFVIELPESLPKWFDLEKVELFDGNGGIRVPAFGGILIANIQQMGTLTIS